jgi:hypothetical protein
MESKNYEIEWEGIKISIAHTHKQWGVIEHIEIKSIDPVNAVLPITGTGYKSHFIVEERLNQYASPIDYVRAWLEFEAAKPEWKARQEDSRQYSLF